MSKKRFVIKRILQIIPMLFIASILAFGLSHASRGEVANSVIRSRGMQPTPETIEAVREELGLDKPVHIQYFSWLKDAARLDFGNSFLTDEPVMEEIAQRFPNTLLLAVVTTAFSIIFGIFFAILSVKYKGRPPDHIIRVVSTAGASIPDFVLAFLFLFIFAINLKFFPVISGSLPQNVILPALTLSIPLSAIYTRLIRNDLIDIMDSDYIKTARAKGLSENQAMIRHGLKNAVLPSVTLIGSNLGFLLAGSFTIESIFSWNGIGKFVFDSVKAKDLPVIQAFIIIVSATFILLNLIIDIIYIYLDPKIKLT